MLTIFLGGCSNDESPSEELIIDRINNLDLLKKEYNITIDGLSLESFTYGIDTTQIFINGRINETLWIGCYNKTTKNMIFEWAESEKLDTVFYLHKGYGEYSNFFIKRFFIRYPLYKNGQLYFLLWGYNEGQINIDGRIISSDLYFIKNNSLVKKRRSYSLPIDEAFYQNIIPWEKSIFSKYNNEYICFSSDGDSLYSTNKISVDHEPINIEECIFHKGPRNSNENIYYFSRLNLKNSDTVWENEIKPIVNFSTNDKLDSTVIKKNNSIWDYSFFYTRFDGNRYAIQLELDIELGSLTSK